MPSSRAPVPPMAVDGIRSTDTRTAIIEAAWLEFESAGTRQAKIVDIARRAGLSRGTVYTHFANKSAIIEAMADDALERIHAAMRQAMDLEDRLDEKLGRAAEVLARNRRLLWRWQQVFIDREVSAFLGDRNGRLLHATCQTIEPYIRRAHQAGETRPDLDVALAAEWFARILFSMYTTPSPNMDVDDPRAVRRFVVDHVVAGFGPHRPPGREVSSDLVGLVGLRAEPLDPGPDWRIR